MSLILSCLSPSQLDVLYTMLEANKEAIDCEMLSLAMEEVQQAKICLKGKPCIVVPADLVLNYSLLD